MKENRYDDPLFFEKYSQMSRSRLGLAGAGEWEDLQKLLPDFAGKQVLDSRMTFRREGVPMGLPGFSEFELWQTSEANIRAARTALDAL